MSNKNKNKNQAGNFLPGFQDSVELLKNHCASTLSEKRIRRAFLYLKELLAHKDFPADSLPLAGKIIEQKMLQMHQEGDDSQIGGMFQAVLAKTPALREHIQPEYMALAHWQESNGSYWQKYESDAAIKDQLDAFVLKLLRDPHEIASHKLIAETQPLKQTANFIVSVWAELEQGNSDRLEELNRSIGRHSPFVAWRLFLNALQTFYSGLEEPALDNLARIPEDSPLFKVASELACLIRNRGKASGKLQETILTETRETSLIKKVIQLQESLENSLSSYQRNEMIRSVFSDELRKNSPLLYWNLGLLFHSALFTRIKNKDPWLDILLNVKDSSRMLLLANHLENKEKLADWIEFANTEGLSKLERALVYDWIATLVSLKLHPEDQKDSLFFQTKINPERAINLFQDMQYYWEKSTQLYPLREPFAKWHRMAEYFLPPSQSDEILEKWLLYFPDDIDVFYKLFVSARKRKGYTKASSQLNRLQKVAPSHHALTLAKELLEIENILGLIEKSRSKEAIGLMDEFSPASCLFVSAFQNFVRVLMKRPGVTLEYPLIACHLQNTMQRNKFLCQSKISLPTNHEADAEKIFQEFEALLSQRDALWGDLWLSDLIFPEKGMSGLGRISSERLWGLCRVFMDQASSYKYGCNLLNFLWILSAEGMSRHDKQSGAFLFLRGYVLLAIFCLKPSHALSSTIKNRSATAFAASEKLLRSFGNLDPMKNLEHYLHQLKTSQTSFSKISDNMSLNKAGKVMDEEIPAKLSVLSKKLRLPDLSFHLDEGKRYPRLLEGYRIFPDGNEDFDEYDSDEFDEEFDDDDEIEEGLREPTPEEFSRVLAELCAALDKGGHGSGKPHK